MATQVTDPDEYARLCALARQIYAGYGRLSDQGGGCGAPDPCHPARAAVAASCSRLRSRQVCNIASFYSRGRSRLLSHLASDEAFGGPGIDDAPGIDLLTLSFVAVVDAIPLDDRRVAI